MNICQVCISDGWGGAEAVVYELARHLRDKGENVSLVLNHEILKFYRDLENVKLFDIGHSYPPDSRIPRVIRNTLKRDLLTQFLRLGYHYLDELLNYRHYKSIKDDLMRFLFENQIDIINTHLFDAAVLVSTLKSLGSPTIITIHGTSWLRGITPEHPLVRPIVKWRARQFRRILAKADKVIGVSKFTLDTWEEQGVKFKNKPIVINNGVNTGDISNSSLAVDLKAKFNLLFPGGAKWTKGGDLLIAALAKVKLEIPDCHLYIALDVPKNSLLRKMVNELDLESNVTFSGFLLKDEYERLLKSIDILILPSRSEAFGMAILEAMALGKPIIASVTGGIPEVLQHDRNGILIEPCSEQIASAILYLYHNPEIRSEITRNNLQDAARFNWNLITDQYINVYKQVLEGLNKNIYFSETNE